MDALDRIRVAAPCDARWEDMTGDERVRRCASCQLQVYDLARLQRTEALGLLREHEGRRLCMRLWRRPDGRVLTADCPLGVRGRVGPLAYRLVLTGVAALALTAAVLGASHARPAVEGWLARTFPSWFAAPTLSLIHI